LLREAGQAERHAGAIRCGPAQEIALGERSIMMDGGENLASLHKYQGAPVEIMYPAEGSPLVIGPNGIFKAARKPNAARLFQSYCFSVEAQQSIIDVSGYRSVHPQTKERAGRKLLAEIKTIRDDPEGVEQDADKVKARYSKIFRV